MLHNSRVLMMMLILAVAVQACAAYGAGVPDPAAASTAAAETVIAGFVETALSQTLLPAPQESTPSFTPGPAILSETPTLVPTETLTPTQIWTATPVFTYTPVVPRISVSVPTNCRVGPGKVYRMVGAILVGESAEVYGRDPTGQYWYIRNPNSHTEFCWAWGEYATVSGDTSRLPVHTPPPTPRPTFTSTPAPYFTFAYTRMETCTGWWPEFELENTGSIPFKSIGISVRDTVTDTVVAIYEDGFENLDGCSSSSIKDTLAVGKTRVVSGPPFKYNPTGHKLHATIILCSDTDQKGLCVTQAINFTP